MITHLKTLCLVLSTNGRTLRPDDTFLPCLRDNDEMARFYCMLHERLVIVDSSTNRNLLSRPESLFVVHYYFDNNMCYSWWRMNWSGRWNRSDHGLQRNGLIHSLSKTGGPIH